ncbi:hypothetical protein D3C71_1682130 [compost metagenome]
MRNPLLADRILKRLDNVLLSHHILKRLRPPGTVQRNVFQFCITLFQRRFLGVNRYMNYTIFSAS